MPVLTAKSSIKPFRNNLDKVTQASQIKKVIRRQDSKVF